MDWLYPPVCLSCGIKGSRLCPDCQKLILYLKHPICTICGIPIVSVGVCTNCRKIKPGYDLLRSWAVFTGPIQIAVHDLKYKRDLSLGFYFADFLSSFVKDLQLPCEIVIPVPLGKKRLTDRGYNQASLIAFPLAHKLGLKYSPKSLIRIRETESQVGLNFKARMENVKDAFIANSRLVSGKNILIIDDVATTGSTLSSCSWALKAGGAINVSAITISRALVGIGSSVSNN